MNKLKYVKFQDGTVGEYDSQTAKDLVKSHGGMYVTKSEYDAYLDRENKILTQRLKPHRRGKPVKFTREERYIVLKKSDVQKALTRAELNALTYLTVRVTDSRYDQGKAPLQCVVVEHDWPEFEPTWKAIEKRVSK